MFFDPDYRDGLAERAGAVRGVVVLPYDSTDQVTSGVLVDAIASGRPVVATAFPHAVELLGSGAGLVVAHDDPDAMTSALRRVLTDPRLAGAMAAEARRLAPTMAWPVVAKCLSALWRTAVRRSDAGTRMTASTPAPVFDHLLRLTDHRGTFEHARLRRAAARARLLHRRYGPGAGRHHPRTRDWIDTQGFAGARGAVPRRSAGPHRCLPQPDGQHRAIGPTARVRRLLGPMRLGSGHRRRAQRRRLGPQSAVIQFERAAQERSTWPRAMAFAALGAAELLTFDPEHRGRTQADHRLRGSVAEPNGDPAGRGPSRA